MLKTSKWTGLAGKTDDPSALVFMRSPTSDITDRLQTLLLRPSSKTERPSAGPRAKPAPSREELDRRVAELNGFSVRQGQQRDAWFGEPTLMTDLVHFIPHFEHYQQRPSL